MRTQIEAKDDTLLGLSGIPGAIHVSATDNSASLGHFVNQSIVQQFTNEGNMRQRRLKKKKHQ